MFLLLTKIVIGLLVGTLVGITGIGGGVFLLPVLIFGLGVAPLVAVGSDAVFNSFTKLGAGYMHVRQGTVNWRLVYALLTGSVPGAFMGVCLLAYLRSTYGTGVNDILRALTGLLLVIIPTLVILQGHCRRYEEKRALVYEGCRTKLFAIGLLSGLLVGMTSIGSGSVTMMLLLAIFPYAPALVVGTDIVHAVVLTGCSSLLHFRLGTVDPMLVAALLVGSIPGGLLGTRLSTRIPSHWLKRILCGVLFVAGARMLWV